MAQVRWLPESIEDFDRLYKLLQRKDSTAAARAVSCILKGATLLKTSPRIGRPMPDETGRHELFIALGAGAYVLRYMLETDKSVIIIRVWHSRESRQ